MKNTVMKMKNAFDGLVSRLDMVPRKESVSLRYINRKFPNWDAKKNTHRIEYVKSETISKDVTYM